MGASGSCSLPKLLEVDEEQPVTEQWWKAHLWVTEVLGALKAPTCPRGDQAGFLLRSQCPQGNYTAMVCLHLSVKLLLLRRDLKIFDQT